MKKRGTATVIGAGIQGCLIALQLVRKGYDVHLVEKSFRLYNQASLNQEGKIHLGFIYALDETHKTSQKLLVDALHFYPVLEDLFLQKIPWQKIKSTHFHYLVAADSMLNSDSLRKHYTAIEDNYRELIRDPYLSYLGERPDFLFSEVHPIPEYLAKGRIESVFRTEECALEPIYLRKIIVNFLKKMDRIHIHLNMRVCGIHRTSSGFLTECTGEGKKKFVESDILINASWDGKRKLDRLMGIQDDRCWGLRLKYGILAKNTFGESIPSFSMVLGPYGDYVHYPKQDYTYFSWYPECMAGLCNELEMTENWEKISEGIHEEKELKNRFYRTTAAFRSFLPGLPELQYLKSCGGIILARGDRDIHEWDSELHQRADPAIEVSDGYFSVNTGKFTSAPLNSVKLAGML